jgi:polysaccharide export outer membrane protein
MRTLLQRITAAFGAVVIFGFAAFAQQAEGNAKPTVLTSAGSDAARAEKADAAPSPTPSGDPKSVDTGTDENPLLPYYENYLKEYRLGPGDVISVEVFGQCPDYCKTGITIPPNARISYPLVREGVFVAGKTVEQVAADITKKLDEYIIDPKVTVTLDKAVSTRYSVMGRVVQPGVRTMDRKISVYEAILDAGGVAKGGDKRRAYIVSYNAQGRLQRREVDLAAIESGKAEMVYLNPGDQVFVPGKGFTVDTFFKYLGAISSVRYLMGSPF